MTKEAFLNALWHSVELGVAAVGAEITAQGLKGTLTGKDMIFQWADLVPPLAVFGMAFYRGLRLYLLTPAWDGKERRSVTDPPKP